MGNDNEAQNDAYARSERVDRDLKKTLNLPLFQEGMPVALTAKFAASPLVSNVAWIASDDYSFARWFSTAAS